MVGPGAQMSEEGCSASDEISITLDTFDLACQAEAALFRFSFRCRVDKLCCLSTDALIFLRFEMCSSGKSFSTSDDLTS